VVAAYEHTQRGPAWLLFGGAAVVALVVAIALDSLTAWVPLGIVAVVLVVASLLFTTLTVRDAGDHLALRYGPLPLVGKKLAYDSIRELRPARSQLIDGWGIHWFPGRGWTFNVWGRDCIEAETEGGTVRIGTDDRDGLLRFLAARTGVQPSPERADQPARVGVVAPPKAPRRR
jgi:hypothetical protein